ncbi:hypothetical protein [Daejeonella oryzae]|uniref:hypothetical protein n=1 Tax=Daejeonella oryzae TaxID=1122943 RepID=UPI00041C29DD|nr:hypothetical protein [Daejeonella oryzae]
MSKDNSIPTQKIGAESDTSSEVILNSTEAAIEHFKTVKQRLLDVSKWHSISGKFSADFTLTDNEGNPVNRLAQEGDFFKIKIPAPKNETGDGYDWVQIQGIEDLNPSEHIQSVSIKVKPAANPQNLKEETAHFFKDEASSTFLVKRDHQTIAAEVHGRNEVPNTDADFKDSIRNLFVALGAMLGFSKTQWKAIVEGLIEVDDSKKA